MSFFSTHFRRLRWLNLPGALLLTLLQRAPVLRIATVAEESMLASPAGAVIRAAVATVASLGAMHSLAGATQVVANTGSVNTTVGTAITPVVFVTNGAPTNAASYIVTGLPPGLTVPGLNPNTNIVNVTNPQGSGLITGTPTLAGAYTVTIQAWEFANAQGNFSATISVLFTISGPGATGQPSITVQPLSQVTVIGQSVTLSIGVTANPPATYQWLKNGFPISGATGASFTIADVKFSDDANYVVNVTNSFGTVVSSAAVLNVLAAAQAPTITLHPVGQTISTGGTVVFSGAANAAPTASYQWFRGSSPIVGATSATLVLTGSNVVAGNYTFVASNSISTATSSLATLTVTNTTNPGHLINLSILTPIAAGETMTMGTVLGGAGTSGKKALLARAAGPSLAQLGVTGVLPDPKMTVIARDAGLTLDTNDNWGGTSTLTNAFAAVGAFPYTSNSSKDAAIFLPAVDPGGYTVQVSDVAGTSGTAIAELYDSTPNSAFNLTTPRLVNVSVLKQPIVAGTTLTAGFVIGGTTSRTMLVRAIGPGLSQFGVGSVMADPKLALFREQTKIAENDNWGGDAQITAVGTSVGAFKIDSATSKDAILLVTLAPGNYSAQVTGVGGGGAAIVEVYEVP